MKKIDYQAKLVIHNLPTYSRKEVRGVIKWLRHIADELEEEKDLNIYTVNPVFRLMK